MRRFFLELQDKRINFVARQLKQNGSEVLDFLEDYSKIHTDDVVVVSPAHKWTEEQLKNLPKNVAVFGGNVAPDLLPLTQNIDYHNLIKNEMFVLENAKLTAEGFLADLILNTPASIYEQKILVIGSGRVAKAVWGVLYKLGVPFCAIMRNEKELSHATIFANNAIRLDNISSMLKEYDTIINTVPAKLFDDDNGFKKDAVVFELASKKCIEFESDKIKYVLCPALPAKYTPQTAGELIYEQIKFLQGENK